MWPLHGCVFVARGASGLVAVDALPDRNVGLGVLEVVIVPFAVALLAPVVTIAVPDRVMVDV